MAINSQLLIAGLLAGSEADDALTGSAGDDTLEGLAGNDTLDGALGDDLLLGGDDNDTLIDREGDNTLQGGSGDDQILGTGIRLLLDGGDGADFVQAEGESQLPDGSRSFVQGGVADLIGGAGGDWLRAAAYSEARLVGGEGDDDIEMGGVRHGEADGGAGNDYINVFVVSWGSGETDGEQRLNESYALHGGADDDFIQLTGYTFSWFGYVTGTLSGGTGNDLLRVDDWVAGGVVGGIDTPNQNGGFSHVTLDGGEGDDSLTVGGALQATLTGGSGSDLFVLTAHQYRTLLEGTRAFQQADGSSVSITAEPVLITDFAAGNGGDVLDVSDLLLTASPSYVGGNPFASGFLVLQQAGADARLIFDADGASGLGGGVVVAVLTGVDVATLDAVNFVPDYAPDGTPTPDQVFTGDASSQAMTSAAGNDTLFGADGNDSLSAHAGDDVLGGGEGDDTLEGGFGNDHLAGDLGDDTLTDNLGINLLQGGAGNDALRSQSLSGESTLEGGAGSDRLLGMGKVLLLDGGDDADRLEAQGFMYHGGTGNYVRDSRVTLLGGNGDDELYANQLSIVTLDGGEGADRLEMYEVYQGALSGGAGADHITVRVSTHSSRNSEGYERLNETFVLDGGDDDDFLQLTGYTSTNWGSATASLMGGGGNDVLRVSDDNAGNGNGQEYGFAASALSGGDGNDTLSVGGVLQATLTGGTGSDRFALTAQQYRTQLEGTRSIAQIDGSSLTVTADPVLITDFAAGAGGDVLDYSDLLTGAAPTYDGNNPFESGFLALEQAGSDTHLYFDADGAAGSGSATLIAVLQGVSANSLEAENFDPGCTPPNLPEGAPTAVLAAGTEDIAYTVSASALLEGFSDPDGDTLSVAELTASSGTVTDNGDGTFTIMQAANVNGPVTLSYAVQDSTGGRIAAEQSYTVSAVNDAPTGLGLDNASVPENSPAGTLVGMLSGEDPDGAGETLSYSLVADAGGRFTVDAATGALRVAEGAMLDFEWGSSHVVTAQVTDAAGAFHEKSFTITLDNVADGPFAFTNSRGYTVDVSGLDIAITSPDGAVTHVPLPEGNYDDDGNWWPIWEPSVAGNDDGFVLTFSFQSDRGFGIGGGGGNAAQFYAYDGTKVGTEILVTSETFSGHRPSVWYLEDGRYLFLWQTNFPYGDYPALPDRVGYVMGRVIDAQSRVMENSFVIDSYANLLKDPVSIRISDNGVIHAFWTEYDLDDPYLDSYTVAEGGALNELIASARLYRPPQGAPTAALAAGTEDIAYTVSASALLEGFSDPDGDTLSVAELTASSGTVTDNGDGTFTITQAAHVNGPVTLSYAVQDSTGGRIAAEQSYTVSAVNDAPTGLGLDNASVPENSPAGTLVGMLSGEDPDGAGETLSYSLVADAGGRFTVDAATGALRVAAGASLDFETATSHSVTARVTDAAGATYEQSFTVSLSNVVETQTRNLSTAADSFSAPSDDNWIVDALAGNDQVSTGGGADVVRGNAGDDTLSGGGGDDVFTVSGTSDGYDAVQGGDGNDRINALANSTAIGLRSLSGIETISGNGKTGVYVRGTTGGDALDFSAVTLEQITRIDAGSGNDTVQGSAAADTLLGGAGNDILSGQGGDDVFQVGASAGTDAVDGGAGLDRIVATKASVVIGLSSVSNVEEISANGYSGVKVLGSSTADRFDFSGTRLIGITQIDLGAGNDTLVGSSGADVVVGGAGKDVLTGGAGGDRFIFAGLADSGVGSEWDLINDFISGSDRIDLSAIDASTRATRDQAFTYIGGSAFTGTAGQLRIDTDTVGYTRILGDVNGDRAADFEIRLAWADPLTPINPTASDFIL